ncbi:helix-turn-helix domain-containing protein [Enterococcus sp. 2201sp1_2201st1_B8_2201SCRN_220225]|uniref:helix-turn-helix domain-containing protein n=1 Tax=unclassified Enterococcus TaxID=2608891 RepID=UPI0034A431FB
MQTILSFGEVLKCLRKERKLTQKMLSQGICSQSVLSRIENDEELPNVLVMQQLCQRLGVTMDQVMNMQSVEIQQIHRLFEEMTYLFFHKEYEDLAQILARPNLLSQIYLDTDLQLYYYFLGSCQFFLEKNTELALQYLQQGLSCTFKLDKSNVSAIEIQLISCIGRVYQELGEMDLARENLQYSLKLFHEMPVQRISNMAAKIFYNHAYFSYHQGEIQEAWELAKEGIAVAQKQKSYYYLTDLFQLMGMIHDQLVEGEGGAQYYQASEAVKFIRSISRY